MEIDVENATGCTELAFEIVNFEKCLARSNVVLDPDHLYYFDISFWACVGMVLIFGLPLNCGIVYYEWFGGDPQKRSLGNQILSLGSLTHISSTILCYLFIILLR